MAEKTFKINLKVDGSGVNDLKELKKEIGAVAGSVSELEAKKEALQTAFKSVAFGTKEYRLLAAELGNVNTKLITIEESVADLTVGEKFDGVLKFGNAFAGVAASVGAVGTAFGATSKDVEEATAKISALLVVMDTLVMIGEALGKENKLFTQFIARNTSVLAINTETQMVNTTAIVDNTVAVEENVVVNQENVVVTEENIVVTDAHTASNVANTEVIATNTTAKLANTAAQSSNTAAQTVGSAATKKSAESVGVLMSALGWVTRLMTGWVGVIILVVAGLGYLLSNIKTMRGYMNDLTDSFKKGFFSMTDSLGITNKLARETENLVERMKELADVQGTVFTKQSLMNQSLYLRGKITDIGLTKANIKNMTAELAMTQKLLNAEQNKLKFSKERINTEFEINRLINKKAANDKTIENIKTKPTLDIYQTAAVKKLESENADLNVRIKKETENLLLLSKDSKDIQNTFIAQNNALLAEKNNLLTQEIDLQKALFEVSTSTANFELSNLRLLDILEDGNHKKRIDRINEIADLKIKALKEELKNSTINEAERVRIRTQISEVEQGRFFEVKTETKDYFNAAIALEFKESNNDLTKSIDALNKSLIKSSNIGQQIEIKNKITDLVKSQELLNAASQVEVKNKEKMLELIKKINALTLERDSKLQSEIDKNKDDLVKKEQELLDVKPTKPIKKTTDELFELITKDRFKIVEDFISKISGAEGESLVYSDSERLIFMSDLNTQYTHILDIFNEANGNFTDEVKKEIVDGLTDLGSAYDKNARSDSKELQKNVKKIIKDFDKLFAPVMVIDQTKIENLKKQIDILKKKIAELTSGADVGDTKIDEDVKKLTDEIVKLGIESGLTKEDIENLLTAKDKIEVTNNFEKQLIRENTLLDLQKALLGALSLEILKLEGKKVDFDKALRDMFLMENINFDKFIEGRVKMKDVKKTAKEFKEFINQTISEINKLGDKENRMLLDKIFFDQKLLDSQIEITLNKLKKKISDPSITEGLNFSDFTKQIAEEMKVSDITEVFTKFTNDQLADMLKVTKIGFLTSDSIDLLREYISLQQQKVLKAKEYDLATAETTKKIDEQVRALKGLIKPIVDQAVEVANKLTSAFGGLFSSMYDLYLYDLNRKFNLLQIKIDNINAQIESSQSRIEKSQEELKSANGARRKQILENLDAERVRLAALQVQKDENEKKQKLIDKERIRSEKEQQAISSVTNTINQIGLAITAINAALKSSDTPSILLKLAAVAATVAAVTAGIGTIRSFEDGGLLEGNSHAQGGIRGKGSFSNVEVEGGEFIVNKKSTAKYLPVLDMINKNKFENGGVLPNIGTDQSTLNRLAEVEERMVMLSQRPIYVSVTDINDESSRLANVIDKTVF